MNSNQATLQKLEMMGLWGMMRALRESMEAGSKADFTPDELISRLVDVEWDERQGRKLSRLLKGARFRYRAGLEDSTSACTGTWRRTSSCALPTVTGSKSART